MNSDYNRFWAFEGFACGNNGNALRRRIHGMARHYASSYVVKLDPNWHSIEIRFDDMHGPNTRLTGRPITDKDACHVDFDYRPSEFVLVGPKVGHVDLLEHVFEVIPEPLFMLIRTCDVMKEWFHTLYNPKHVIEIIDGKTVIEFENCTRGVVCNVHEDTFDVEDIGEWIEIHDDQRHYTMEKLKEEFKLDAMWGQAVDVSYLPFLPVDGKPMDTPEAIREVRRQQEKVWRAKQEAEEERRQAEEAAAEAAMSPEERAERDERRAQMVAQAEVVKRLMPLLPRP